jgi:outer membrane receptor protein involved in Fe transport
VRFIVRSDRVIETSGGLYAENRTQWLEKFRAVAGLREDVFYGTDASTLAANSGSTDKGMFSPKINAVFGPWARTELYLSYGQGFHSNDFRGAVSTVDALQTELNQQQGNNTTVAQGKTPLLTKAEGYEIGLARRRFRRHRGRPFEPAHRRRAQRRLCAPAVAVLRRRFGFHLRALYRRR